MELKTIKRICHLADFQLEARSTPTGNRYDEMIKTIDLILERIREQKPEMNVITGDLIEFCRTTSAERMLLSYFLKELSNIATTVISLGNHDLASTNNTILMNNDMQVISDDVENVIKMINLPNIHLLKRTGFYEVDGVKFANWGHYEKYNKVDRLPYSPWDLDDAKDKNPMDYIELFHDPIANCKGFDDKPMEQFSSYKIKLSHFRSPLVLAGDIHNPDIIRTSTTTFTYCSSTIMRNFGEGNYYRNGICRQKGNSKHGFNMVNYNGTRYSEIEFIRVNPIVTRHTIELDEKFKYDDYSLLDIQSSPLNMIRFKVLDNVDLFYEHQDKIYEYLKGRCNCIIEDPVFGKTVGIDFNDVETTVENMDELFTTESILEKAQEYINVAIDKTSTVSADEKEKGKELLMRMFRKEFAEKGDIINELKDIRLVSFDIDNALTFGDGVNVKFSDECSIVRVLGSNAVGKTKLYTLVGYMFTDVLDQNMKVTTKKDNRLSLFNYTRPNDVVNLVLSFTVNGQPYKLTKTISRNWKRGVSNWRKADWKNSITGVPSLEVTLTKPTGEVVDNYESVHEFMTGLINQNEFFGQMFVNQSSLSQLLKMKSDKLIFEILRIVGLDFFEPMNERYDDFKDKTLNSLTKPEGTIDGLFNKIAENDDDIKKNESRLEEIKLDFKSIDIEKEELNSKLKELNEKVGNVKPVSEIEKSITESNTKMQSHSDDLAKKNTELDKLNTANENLNLDSINKSITEKEAEKLLKIQEKSNKVSEKNNIQPVIDTIETEIRNHETMLRNEHNKKITDIEAKIIDKKSKKAVKNTRLKEIGNIVQTRLNERKELHNNELSKSSKLLNDKSVEYNNKSTESSTAKNNLESSKSSYNTLEERLHSLEDSTKCHKCNAYVDKDIEGSIQLTKNEMIEKSKDISKYNELVIKLSNEALVLLSEKDKLQKEYDALKSKEITYKITEDAELTKEVKEISTFFKTIDIEIKELETKKTELEDDETYLDVDYIKTRKNQIVEKIQSKNTIDLTIKTLQDEIDVIDGDITKLRSNIDLKNRIENAITSTKGSIDLIEKDIEIVKGQLTILENEKLVSNGLSDVFKDIEFNEGLLKKKDEVVIQLTSEQSILKTKNVTLREGIVNIEKDIVSLKKYNLITSILKQYKIMLGNKGLQKYIFISIIDLLNKNLSELLSDVPLRLFFDKESLELRMIDLKKEAISGVLLTSGMETSILGLSLLKSLKSLNRLLKTNFLFIDEISGQLNNGEGLSYKADNYEKVFVDLMSRMKQDISLYVVDHDIEDIGETRVLEVIPTNDGSKIVEKI
ncbi:DNA repair [Tenacibaculum phage pT24]|uniref:DNA repair n=1 Tax=Tenacibaculum phage pT24 TaxID=1880590 RepID=A0A1B4XWF0_9CAUD|nr:metallo-phosphoesterase [Tenacibaculum phage pT24]BAV39141.1 DNA repair [Tenacibaculum phage pT24]